MTEVTDELETEESKDFACILGQVADAAAKDELKRDDFEISVTVTDGATIRVINAEHRGVDKETDVLSFPLWDRNSGEEPFVNPETDNIMLGDIVISLPRVKEQAEEYGHSMRREAAYLCVHGTLHLLGYDHMQDDEKAVMRRREEEILSALKLTRED